MAISSQNVGKEICEILGLDPMKTRRVNLIFESRRLVTADAEIYVETEEFDMIKPILKRYKMVPIVEVVDVTPLGADFKVSAILEEQK